MLSALAVNTGLSAPSIVDKHEFPATFESLLVRLRTLGQGSRTHCGGLEPFQLERPSCLLQNNPAIQRGQVQSIQANQVQIIAIEVHQIEAGLRITGSGNDDQASPPRHCVQCNLEHGTPHSVESNIHPSA